MAGRRSDTDDGVEETFVEVRADDESSIAISEEVSVMSDEKARAIARRISNRDRDLLERLAR